MYSSVDDLLLGNIPVPADALKYVRDAGDEIDSKLGFRYQTPIVVTDSPANRVTILLLKRISNWLASGRLILAKSASSETQYVHAYGRQLVKEAEDALNAIATGQTNLPGAEFLDSEDLGLNGPVIGNTDAKSNVESFYTFVQQDPYFIGSSDVLFPAGTQRRAYYPYVG